MNRSVPRPTRTVRAAAAYPLPSALLVTALLFSVSTSCTVYGRWPFWSTQRDPGLMTNAADPLPPGAQTLYPEGPEEVLVIRHADPVKVRPAERTAGFPLSFYDKTTRVHAGSSVTVAPGGRVEVLWNDGSSILMSDRGFGLIGSPSRGESMFTMFEVTTAWIDLQAEEQIDLVGGARLSAASGPIVLERVRADIVRVKNQSKESCRVSIREDVIDLDPGQAVDLPILSAGGRPTRSATSSEVVVGPGFEVRSSGSVQTGTDATGVRVQAVGEHEIQGMGVRARLERGEEIEFQGLGPR